MPANASITLVAPFANGTGGEAQLFHLGQFDFAHNPLVPAVTITATSNQPTFVAAVVSGLDVDVRAIKTGGGTTTITITDSRPGITPVTINVLVNPAPNLSSLEILSSDPIRSM